MRIDGEKFLISVTKPLQLTLQSCIASEGIMSLGMVLQSHLSFLSTIVYMDRQSVFRTMVNDFPGVEINTGGAGGYVDKVDAKIRRIKDTYRSVKSGLLWKLPKSKVKDLLAYVVSRLNLRRTTVIECSVSARVLFTGVRPNCGERNVWWHLVTT